MLPKKTLEEIAIEKDYVTLEEGGKLVPTQNMKNMEDFLSENIEHFDPINKRIIKGYQFVKRSSFIKAAHELVNKVALQDLKKAEKRFDKAMQYSDVAFTAIIGGTYTRRIQEVMALVAGIEPWRLTRRNSLLGIPLSLPYVFGGNIIDKLATAASNNPEASTIADEIGMYIFLGLSATNIARIGLATTKKKAYAAIGLELSIILNGPAYFKIAKDYIKSKFNTSKQTYINPS